MSHKGLQWQAVSAWRQAVEASTLIEVIEKMSAHFEKAEI